MNNLKIIEFLSLQNNKLLKANDGLITLPEFDETNID